jgi:hypothetical protein
MKSAQTLIVYRKFVFLYHIPSSGAESFTKVGASAK